MWGTSRRCATATVLVSADIASILGKIEKDHPEGCMALEKAMGSMVLAKTIYIRTKFSFAGSHLIQKECLCCATKKIDWILIGYWLDIDYKYWLDIDCIYWFEAFKYWLRWSQKSIWYWFRNHHSQYIDCNHYSCNHNLERNLLNDFQKLGKQAAAMASLDQFCGVCFTAFLVFLLISFLILGVETYVFFIWFLSLKNQKI